LAKVVLVFAPHPDDETLACGGTIAKKVKQGEDVHVVFLTDGRNSHLHTLGIRTDPTPEELALVRKQEARAAAKVLGVKQDNLVFLDVEGGSLGIKNKVVQDRVTQVLLDLRPDEVYYPDRADRHETHRATCDVVEAALKTLDFTPERYRYIVWADEAGYRGRKAKQITIDITETLHLKRRAINEYRSQVTLLSKQQSRPVLTDSFLANFRDNHERFIR
jgi:LmbE family N-acetylglucosaminyl deacetylase